MALEKLKKECGSLNYSGTRFLSTENWNYSLSLPIPSHFCAKVIILSALTDTENAPIDLWGKYQTNFVRELKSSLLSAFTDAQNAPLELYKKLTHFISEHQPYNFFSDFCGQSIKTWEVWRNFFKSQSLSILAICCNRGQKTVKMPNMVSNKKTGPLFLEFNCCKKDQALLKG